MHTPSTPKVNSPASATDPRYSTSGILNAQLKEKNRQGLLSTFGGRTGRDMDINKFADAKNYMRNPSAVSALEALSRLYADAANKGAARGVTNDNHDLSRHDAKKNMGKYNDSVDAVNNYLKQYNVEGSGLTKASGLHNADQRVGHNDNWVAYNKDDIKANLNSAGESGEVFNQVAENAKKQKQAAKK